MKEGREYTGIELGASTRVASKTEGRIDRCETSVEWGSKEGSCEKGERDEGSLYIVKHGDGKVLQQ